jgi:phosphatidylglycerol:prolipoprotein diacylglycerol transferase
MTFPDFEPVAVQLGPLAIRWYAMAYVAGILLGWAYARRLIARADLWGTAGPPIATATLADLVTLLTVGVIVGGRLGYVVFYEPAVLWTDPMEVLRSWRGGMSFHGGLIGVAIELTIFSRPARIPLRRLGDLVAPCAPIGLFFGRLANFINGELWGRPTDAPWGVVFCNARLQAAGGGMCAAGLAPRHPSQLYEAALEGLALFLILRLATHRASWLSRPGAVSGLFLVCYGLLRIALETVRNPDLTMPNFPFGLTMGMMLSAPVALAGAWLFLTSGSTSRSKPETQVRSFRVGAKVRHRS